ncbi:response regulator [Terasakiella sp. SH-1]|uniref:response regulator n=1 Tax=Terasakiella sp. SH-1 TaxID=2560057 RepID=UPI0010736B0A|nr:response regulator [Terasakiella sp. SH-1]
MRVLFVDDEVNVLNALARTLRHKRGDWEMDFANSGYQAIDLFEQHPYDVIVSDMMMPQMSGEKLLDHIWRHFPDTARVVLSGHCNQATAFRLVGSEHLYLSKPCSYELLTSTIENAYAYTEAKKQKSQGMTTQSLEIKVSAFLLDLLSAGKITKGDLPIDLHFLLPDDVLQSFAPVFTTDEALSGRSDLEVGEFMDLLNDH